MLIVSSNNKECGIVVFLLLCVFCHYIEHTTGYEIILVTAFDGM